MEFAGPAVILMGRSNAGKSSLLNALTRSKIARVAKSPGKTRSINYFRYGRHLILVDLPGFGYARRSKSEREAWSKLVEAFFDKAPPGLMGLLLVDAQRDLGKEETDLIEAFQERSYPVEILLTKADRLNQSERIRRQTLLRKQNLLTLGFVSVKTGEGLDSIRKRLLRYEKDYRL